MEHDEERTIQYTSAAAFVALGIKLASVQGNLVS